MGRLRHAPRVLLDRALAPRRHRRRAAAALAAPVPEGPALFVYGHSYAADHPTTATWPAIVGPALGLPVVNRAVGGDSVRNTLQRAEAHDDRPAAGDLVIVHTGINDVVRRGSLPGAVDDYRATLVRVVERLGRRGATVHVVGEPPLLRWDHGRGLDKGSAEVSAAFRAAAMSLPGAIDLTVGWDAATMLQDDGLHPNDEGTTAMAAAILAALRSPEPS